MMRHTMGIVGILLAALTATTNHCLAFESRPDETVIVIPKPANAVVEAAARELLEVVLREDSGRHQAAAADMLARMGPAAA